MPQKGDSFENIRVIGKGQLIPYCYCPSHFLQSLQYSRNFFCNEGIMIKLGKNILKCE